VTSPPWIPGAHAELGVCYSDPVVVLSNGTILDLSDVINDTDTDVQQVSYTIHAPAGTSVTSVTYTSGPLGPKETFQFFAEGKLGQYDIASQVTTINSGIGVTASAKAVSTAGTASASDTGWSNQQLHVAVAP
jgi:hypothetical protein